MQRMYADQKLALERGEAISVFMKKVPITVVDFYPEPEPA